MGKAIIIPDINFGSTPLGRVTIKGNVPLRAINIDAPSTFIGTTLQLIADLFPLNTTQRDVTWSITSGSTYATIDASTGLLTVLSGANNNNVTVKVSSTDVTGIEATKTIAVTYDASGLPTYRFADFNLTGLYKNDQPVIAPNTEGYRRLEITDLQGYTKLEFCGLFPTVPGFTGLMFIANGVMMGVNPNTSTNLEQAMVVRTVNIPAGTTKIEATFCVGAGSSDDTEENRNALYVRLKN